MALCVSCGAPLRADDPNCAYCGHRNFVNLQAIDAGAQGRPSQLKCPVCNLPMQCLSVETEDETVEIDHCPQCGGIWFDRGELEYLLNHRVKTVFELNHRLMNQINKDRGASLQTRGYIPCPVCGELMPFTNYGKKSGVIVDWCRDHGIWLDGGELAHLLEWAQAGGLMSQRNVMRQERPAATTYAPASTASAAPGSAPSPMSDVPTSSSVFTLGNDRNDSFGDPGRSIIDAILRIFR